MVQEIKSEAQYKRALQKLELIFDAKKGSKDGIELEALVSMIEKYEDTNFTRKAQPESKKKLGNTF